MRYGFLATSVRALVPVALLLTSLTASADGPPPTPTQSGHRLADLERYKAQGKDAYGNDLPQDPTTREQKVNEREAKIQTENGKLDPSAPQQPNWPPNGQEQMRQAHLERQRYYLEQDLKAAEDKAKQAGKTGADLRRDPDVKKARQALLDNENEFLRKKFPLRSAPLALLLDDECKRNLSLARLGHERPTNLVATGAAAYLSPFLSESLGTLLPTSDLQSPFLHKVRTYEGNRSVHVGTDRPPVRLVVLGSKLHGYALEGQIKVGRQQMIPTNSFRITAGLRYKEDKENEKEFKNHYGGAAGWWGLGDDQAPPVGDVDKNGALQLGVSYDFLGEYGSREKYKIGAQVDFNYGEAEVPFYPGDTTPELTYTGLYSPILNLNRMMITHLNDDVNPWQIRDAAKEKGYDVSCWRWDVLPGVGSYLAWQIEESRFTEFRRDPTFAPKIQSVEDNAGVVDAPAAHWSEIARPTVPPQPIPKTRIHRARIRGVAR